MVHTPVAPKQNEPLTPAIKEETKPSKVACKLINAISTTLIQAEEMGQDKQGALLHRLGKGYMPRASVVGVNDAKTLLRFAHLMAQKDEDVVRATSHRGIYIFTLKVPGKYQAFSPWTKLGLIKERKLLSFVKWKEPGIFRFKDEETLPVEKRSKYLRAPECWSQKTDVVTFIIHPQHGLRQWYAGFDPYDPTIVHPKLSPEAKKLIEDNALYAVWQEWQARTIPDPGFDAVLTHDLEAYDVLFGDGQWVLCSEDSHKVLAKQKKRRQGRI